MKTIKTTLYHWTVGTVLASVLAIINPAFAAVVVWNGASGTDINWSTAGNWIGGVAPTSADDVKFFDDGADFTPLNINNVVNASFGGSVLSLGQLIEEVESKQ